MASEMSPTPFPFNPPSRLICRVCEKQFSKYTCPRCNAHYCSLGCYKSHSVGCTESFMRENVVGELRQLQTDDETKRKMIDILRRLHEEEEDDDQEGYNMDEDGSILSEETIQSIQSGRQVDFDHLSAKEKKYFLEALSSGELSKLIQPWEPWWLKPSARNISLNSEGMPLVQPLNDQNDNHSLDIPMGPDIPLSPVSKLISSKPSPLLSVHLVDVVYSYCFTLRLYNGDWQSDPLGASMVVLSISSVLDQRDQPETVREALSSCLKQTCSPGFKHVGGLNFGMALIDDVLHLLSLGSCALICMLSDLERLLLAGLKLEKEQRNKLKLSAKKVYFIMCWVHEQPSEIWSSLAAMVGIEKASAAEFINGDGGGSFRVPEMRKGSSSSRGVVIEELQ